MSSLTPTARVILGMLKLGVATGYDIKKVIDASTRFFWTASFGQIYPELKRLQRDGLVRSRQEPRGKVKRTVYELTPKGEEALRKWLIDREDVMFEIRDESLLRLFFSDMLSKEDVLANVRMQQRLFEVVLDRFREIEVEARAGVEEDDLWVADEREPQVEPTPLAPGERPHPRIALLRQADDVDDLFHLPGPLVIPREV